jgi:hypothetical protein
VLLGNVRARPVIHLDRDHQRARQPDPKTFAMAACSAPTDGGVRAVGLQTEGDIEDA